ncbi:MAG: hypothetical protein B7Z75_06195 [Acidocella sp. 20-57-95]|nr:MAG: hypothetical protein B7Z75_06195 [Acidocella sp. 20-57-95]OYV60249.1 MAG: hypothetical protein B7Z71_06570 [Acidocella sp. 21-58-7]HQT63464.1 hypothetical protein [Acidocella sp.]HQU04850.1 hypothetical protein [Acidocella sp.]
MHGLIMANKISYSRIGFLLTCFLFPGLIGTFASFSIPAPVVDAMHQEAALDAVLKAATPADQQTAMNNLANATDDDTAAIVMKGTGPIADRVAAARANMHVEVVAQARDEAYKIRLMVITMTILGAMFGVALLGPSKQ